MQFLPGTGKFQLHSSLSLNSLYLITVLSNFYKIMNTIDFWMNILISVQYTAISLSKQCKVLILEVNLKIILNYF
jgi:hypothetical protein